MKLRHILLTLALLVAATAMWAKDPAARFDTREHDFGNIQASGGAVSATYRFTNTSAEPVSIVTVTNGGCGCTKPAFSTKPVMPGQGGEIRITFNPLTFKGEFSRSVKVQFSDSRKRQVLKFKGIVLPK